MTMLLSEIMNRLSKVGKLLDSKAELEIIAFNERDGIQTGEVYDILVDLDNNRVIIRLL